MEYSIENRYLKIDVLSTGATLKRFIYKPLNRNIILTHSDDLYYKSSQYGFLGATVGRVGGRISKSKIVINGVTHNLKSKSSTFLHSGEGCFSFKEFELVSQTKTSLVLSLQTTKDASFPGTFNLKVYYYLHSDSLYIKYSYYCDEDTIANIINHAYFNLSNESNIHNHELLIHSSKFQEVDNNLVPTGKNLDVKLLGISDSNYSSLGEILKTSKKNKFNGVDNFFFLNNNNKEHINEIGLRTNELELRIKTSYPGINIYTTNMPSNTKLENGVLSLEKGIALEPQYPNDAYNLGLGTLINKNTVYTNYSEYKIKKRDK
ncbi:MAG: hypothetical protein LBV51_05615 [Acholeplasmatales bacterium]|jgi:aldose 1-epimerase|nr:hypothetical protein [Acholeplasmatales bacterium]